jgi:hypothetical protein
VFEVGLDVLKAVELIVTKKPARDVTDQMVLEVLPHLLCLMLTASSLLKCNGKHQR